jgi:putative transposase
MPWREVCPMDEKMEFIGALLGRAENMTELCERFGISRKTGYKLRARYRAEGAAGIAERSRAPQVIPWAVSAAQAEAIIGVRRAHASWGPKKLRANLRDRAPEQDWPAPSTIGELLRRQGLSQPRKRRRCASPSPSPLPTAATANDLWCIDFKGWFRTAEGVRCDPLTVTDAFSRYLLCLKSVARPDHANCRGELERVFREYGLPHAIRSDNGAPFASVGAGGLSRLSVWWVKLGIAPERIEPGQPQQNGRHERMHRTLKAECASPPAATAAAQQRRFDAFRAEFNHQRPHEALGQTTPARHYTPSARAYPNRLEDPHYPTDFELRRVRSNGEIRWQGELVFIGEALIGEVIGLMETEDGDAEVYFGPVSLGIIDGVSLKLIRRHPGQGSTAGRGGQPAALSSPSKSEKVLPMLPV